MEHNRAEIFRDLKRLGYDRSRIRKVMRAHVDFESALAALEHETSARMQKELRNHGISGFTAEILAERFQSTQEALSFYKEYMSHSRSIRSFLHGMEFSSSAIKSCIDRLLPLDEAIKELLLQQGSASSPTPVPLVGIHSTSSICQESIINNPPPYFVGIPGNIPRNPAGMPQVDSQFSPSPINIPQTLVGSNDEEMVMRSGLSIEHFSIFSFRGSNDGEWAMRSRLSIEHLYSFSFWGSNHPSQRIRRTQSTQVDEEVGGLGQPVELEDAERSDSEVIFLFQHPIREFSSAFPVNHQSIGPNVKEAICKEILQSLNQIVFKETTKMDCEKCMICFDNFAIDEEINILPCVHPFHSGCISTLLETSKLCPICRASLSIYC